MIASVGDERLIVRVTVRLVGGLVHTAGFSQREFELPAGTTVATLLPMIPVDPARPVILARNGRAIRDDEVLEDGDRIMISPIFSGG